MIPASGKFLLLRDSAISQQRGRGAWFGAEASSFRVDVAVAVLALPDKPWRREVCTYQARCVVAAVLRCVETVIIHPWTLVWSWRCDWLHARAKCSAQWRNAECFDGAVLNGTFLNSAVPYGAEFYGAVLNVAVLNAQCSTVQCSMLMST